MLNLKEMINYRLLRGVSQNEVAKNCELSQPMIVMLEKGERDITAYNHREYCKGVNKAYQLKKERMKNAPEKVVKVEEPKEPPLQKVVRKKPTAKKKKTESEVK